MAKYDPKRPRPTLGDPDSAPVEALIDTAPPAVESDELPPEPSPHISDVPVIPPPEEGTANRAVLAALGSGIVLAVVLVVILRFRRRRG